MNNMASDRKNVPFIEIISHLMAMKLSGKSLMDGTASPFIRAWLRHLHHKTYESRIRKKINPENSQHRLLSGAFFSSTLHLIGN
jgi:hypothetical protein